MSETNENKGSHSSSAKSDAPSPPADTQKNRAPSPLMLPPSTRWFQAWKIAAGLGVLGPVGAGAGYVQDPTRFAFSYLFAFVFTVSIGLGAIFFLLAQHLTSAGWSVTVRRTAEFFASGTWVYAILILPVLASLSALYPWYRQFHTSGELAHGASHSALVREGELPLAQADAPKPATGGATGKAPSVPDTHPPLLGLEGAPHGTTANGAHPNGQERASEPGSHSVHRSAEHSELAEHGRGHDAEHALHEATVAKKRPYFEKPFFFGRQAFYVVVWALLGWLFFKKSTEQDSSRSIENTLWAQRFAPVAAILFALTLTFASFDWIMSLEPAWYSTIFGVNYFAGSVVAIFATLILTLLSLRASGVLTREVNTEHYHDLGKLQFGFMVFWAYVSFSQFMLIYYAGIPEETTFFHHRWDEGGPWKAVSLAILFLHFVVPFLMILSRNAKRKLGVLRVGAATLLVMHAVEMYWLVMPNMPGQEHFMPSYIDAACFLGVLGCYLAVVFRTMTKHPLVPVGDPRLVRSLHFENA